MNTENKNKLVTHYLRPANYKFAAILNTHLAKSNFDAFCTRMWLDYGDEGWYGDVGAEHFSRKEYVEKYNDWLKDKYVFIPGTVAGWRREISKPQIRNKIPKVV